MLAVPLMASHVTSVLERPMARTGRVEFPVSALPYLKSTHLWLRITFCQAIGGLYRLEEYFFLQWVRRVDSGLRLFFDAYLPPSNSGSLPGANSVIIRISWGRLDDRVIRNWEYAAYESVLRSARATASFDIQYGLNNESRILSLLQACLPRM